MLIYFPAQYPRLIRPYLCCNTELFWEGGTPSENDLGAIIIMMKSNLLVMHADNISSSAFKAEDNDNDRINVYLH